MFHHSRDSNNTKNSSLDTFFNSNQKIKFYRSIHRNINVVTECVVKTKKLFCVTKNFLPRVTQEIMCLAKKTSENENVYVTIKINLVRQLLGVSVRLAINLSFISC